MAEQRADARTGEVALWRQGRRRTYEDQIRQALTQVNDLVTFVRDEHFALETLLSFWRGDARAAGTVQTIGRLLGRHLAEELAGIHDLLERSLALGLLEFTTTVAPHLFEQIAHIVPLTGMLEDKRAMVEQRHYAVDVRQALLQHVLTSITRRYQMPRFREFAEASQWTDAYSSNLQAAERVISGNRDLLQDEVEAVRSFLYQISQRIEGIEAAAEARFGLVKRVRWISSLEDAEHEVNNLLADRAQKMEHVAFSILTEARQPGLLQMVARRTLQRAPRVGALLLGLAGTGLLARGAAEVDPASLSLKLPKALSGRGVADTGRYTTRSARVAGSSETARVVNEAVRQLVTDVQARQAPTADPARTKVAAFFQSLDRDGGRQTFVIQNQTELVALLDRLQGYGYEREAVLSLLGLPSEASMLQPLTLDMRPGQRQPILFAYQAAAQATAAVSTVGRIEAVYQIRPGDTLFGVGARFGLSAEEMQRANPQLGDGNLLLIGQYVVLPERAPQPVGGLLQRGDTLEQVAALYNVPVETLIRLNGVDNPQLWQYDGGTLRLPAPTLTGGATATEGALGASQVTATRPRVEVTAPQPALDESLSRPAAPQTTGSGEAFIVYRVQPNESLDQIAARYGTTADEIADDNRLELLTVARGQSLLIRRPTTAAPAVTPVDAADSSSGYSSQGSFGAPIEGAPTSGKQGMNVLGALARPAAAEMDATQFGNELYSDLESMPVEARDFLVETSEEVGDFFDVRPGDILGILRSEQNNAGWRLYEGRESSAGAVGVAQIVPRTWNGWASPRHDSHESDVVAIEANGGLGFDWSMREEWRAWSEGNADRSLLKGSDADPNVFENSVAAIARHLVHWGLTTEFAERDPAGFAERLADAIAVYNSGRTLDVSGGWVQSADNAKTTGQYVAEAIATSEEVGHLVGQPSIKVAAPNALQKYNERLGQLYDMTFGVDLSAQEVAGMIAANQTQHEDVRSGKVEPEQAAMQLMQQVELGYITEGRQAIRDGSERPWPFIHNYETLYAQKNAVNLIGRTLTLFEMDDLMHRTRADHDAIRQELLRRGDAQLFTRAKVRFDQMLDRSARGMPVRNSEVSRLVQPLMAGHSPYGMSEATLSQLTEALDEAVGGLAEYRQLHGSFVFQANPLLPMPEVFKGFGVAVDYQSGGRHTGIDVANPGEEYGVDAPLYAVEDGTVEYVGPLYCDLPDACRGGQAIVLDHGNQVYSIYSHNSEVDVQPGAEVRAGERIGRQGSEGYSFGSHLHFEVHVGAPFSDDWQEPFGGGEFVDPMKWLPAGQS